MKAMRIWYLASTASLFDFIRSPEAFVIPIFLEIKEEMLGLVN